MKKLTCLTVVLLILVAGCSSMGVNGGAQKTPLTKANMAMLQGTWEGWMNFRTGLADSRLTMTVDNNAPPFKGTLRMADLPPGAAALYPGAFLGDTTYSGPFSDGLITSKGTFIITGAPGSGNFGEFSLVGANELKGWFYLWGTEGTISLKKK